MDIVAEHELEREREHNKQKGKIPIPPSLQKTSQEPGNSTPSLTTEPKKTKYKRKSLNVKSQRIVLQAIRQVESANLLAAVLGEVDDQLHIAVFSGRSAFWEKLNVTDLLPSVCTSLKDVYRAVYAKCG